MRLAFLFAASLHAELLSIQQTFDAVACASCSASLEKSLGRMRGVSSVKVDMAAGVARIELEKDNRVRLHLIRDRFKGVGFTPGVADVKAIGRAAGKSFIVEPSGESFALAAPLAHERATVEGTATVAPEPVLTIRSVAEIR